MTTTPVYFILHGDDEFNIRQRVRAFRARMADADMGDLNVSVMDGRAVAIPDIIAAAMMAPFMTDKRLVIVEGALTRKTTAKSSKGDADMQLLADALPHLPDTTRLVLVEVEPLKETHPVMKAAAASGGRGKVESFAPPRDASDWQKKRWDAGWVQSWIVKRVEHYGGRIEPRAAALLATAVGQDLYAADSECAKLVDYVGLTSARPITESDIAAMSVYKPDAIIWDITDALGQGDKPKAMRLISRYLTEQNENAFGLLSMIGRQFRQLIQMREVIDGQAAVQDSPELAAMKDYPRKKLTEQAKRFKMTDLEAIYRYLLELDFSIKQGKLVKTSAFEAERLAIDLLVAGL